MFRCGAVVVRRALSMGVVRIAILALAVIGLALSAPRGAALAAGCTADDFARAVDEAGAALRALNLDNAPKLGAKLRQLRQKKGWSESDDEEMAHDYLSDAKLSNFDATANELLARIDTLGRPAASGAPDCAKLDDLKAASLELIAVMKAKASYTMAKIDGELALGDGRVGGAPAGAAAGVAAAKPPAPAGPAPTQPAKAAPDKMASDKAVGDKAADKTASDKAAGDKAAGDKTAGDKPAGDKTAAVVPAKPSAAPGQWSTTTEAHAPSVAATAAPGGNATAGAPGQAPAGPSAVAGVPAPVPPVSALPALVPVEEGFTIEEIRDATKGFFGIVSTNLATVIEHTFSSLGRPTAYVLGTEGGGAFLAGLRYGSGLLYMRAGGSRPVHWHGPSVGYDFGAAGSRTMFLIYGLKDSSQLFRSFTGVDGSAYVIGGVGVTFLKGGDVVMAPIRSGLGLRLGANIGYVRFTSEPSWNPF